VGASQGQFISFAGRALPWAHELPFPLGDYAATSFDFELNSGLFHGRSLLFYGEAVFSVIQSYQELPFFYASAWNEVLIHLYDAPGNFRLNRQALSWDYNAHG
jgi:hypothetical protein